ncbi:hypothetical protein VMCG_00228 [Cytospora schulzeri]|uniref:Uncharacterized protein n=1 Tax=Cytospora schulzeri TaxID=448051 RepID=A0A423X9B3_9PEZI|nr:hypothetical protein VMCG_00228 [Valsa malicola]
MPQQEPRGQECIMVDLTSDNESVPPPSQVVDLTLSDDYDSSSQVTLESTLGVDVRTPNLTSGHGQGQGSVISPNTQAATSSDDEMTLSSTLTQCRKRKHGTDNTAVPKLELGNFSPSRAKEALQSFPQIKSLKPSTNFWTIHQTVPTQPKLSFRQPKVVSKNKVSERTSDPNKQSNPRILNIDRNEVFDRNNEETQSNKTNRDQHTKVNGQRFEKSASREGPSSLDFSPRTIELAKKSTTSANTEEQHVCKRPRFGGPGSATTNGGPRTKVSPHTNPVILEADKPTEDLSHSDNTQIEADGRNTSTAKDSAENVRADVVLGVAGVTDQATPSNNTSRAKPQSFAFDDKPSTTNVVAHRRQPGTTIPASQPNVTEGIPRTSSSSVGRRRRPWENTQQSASVSHQLPNRRSSSPVGISKPRRGPVTPTDNQWAAIKRLHKRSVADDAKRISKQPKKTSQQRKHANKDTQELARDALSRQRADDLFDSDTSSHASYTIQDAQQPPRGHHETQPRRHEPTDIGYSQLQQPTGGHIRQQQPVSQPKPQPRSSTIKLSTNPTRPEPNRPSATRNETFEDAAASFNLLQSQHEKKRTTTILDSVPADLGMPSRASRTQAVYRANNYGPKPRNTAKANENRRNQYRERAIRDKRTKLEEKYADEPDELEREGLINKELGEYLQKLAENERKRKRQAPNYLTVEFLEEGAGADNANSSNNHPCTGGAPAPRPRGVIPASQAMEPNETMVLYAVYISDPFDEGEDYENHMKRAAEAFVKKEEANAFAQKLLTGMSPSSRQRSQDAATGVWYKTDRRGLLFGRKWLPDGRVICCMVEKEKQAFGLLDMSNKWVREEVKDVYRPRFDVFIMSVIPKVFLDKEEEKKSKRMEKKAKGAAAEAEAEMETEEGKLQEEENGGEEKPWVWKLDDEEQDNGSLFSPNPTPEPEAAREAQDKSSSQGSRGSSSNNDNNNNSEDDNDDTTSVSSDATLQPSHPGGALGRLSYADVEYCSIHAGAYTDLRLANEQALEVARLYWKPRNARLDACLHYSNAVLPSIKEARDTDLDAGPADIVFEVPELDGLVEHRPWMFVHSRVYVVEAKLEGPRDIACEFVLSDGEVE